MPQNKGRRKHHYKQAPKVTEYILTLQAIKDHEEDYLSVQLLHYPEKLFFLTETCLSVFRANTEGLHIYFDSK